MSDAGSANAGGGGAGTQQLSLATAQNAVIALNKIQQTLAASFPVVTAISGSAGAPTGTYLEFLAPDGNTYKIALLAVS